MMLARLFGRSQQQEDPVAACYAAVMAQARQPVFYSGCEVPDTLDGRFDMLALHTFLVMHRLKREGTAAARFSRALFEHLVTDLDRTLREMGVGDLGVPPRVKAMAKGINGRLHAYNRALADEDKLAADKPAGPRLLAALENNLYGTVMAPAPETVARMAGYVRAAVAGLAAQPLAAILAGTPDFPEPPPAAGSGQGEVAP